MEIEVGEYVRTKKGNIGIFKGYNRNLNSPWSCKVDLQRIKTWQYITEEYITKHSKNIIDLIEVGDIVQVKDTHFLDEAKKYMFDIEMLEALKTDIKNNDLEILSILTHEQFEQKAYRLEGK